MTVCSHCGREAAPNNLYCQYCGQKLDIPPVSAQQQDQFVPEQASDGVYYAAGPWMPVPPDESMPEVVPAPSVKVATAPARGRLIVRSVSVSEGQAGADEREFILDDRDVAIGRSPSCDIALSGDQLASRRHALVRCKSGRYTIVDLGSSNGTYVNDIEIREEATLRDGDIIKIGGHEVLFSTGPAGPHASLASARLSQPLPVSPLGETNPNIPAIDSAAIAEADGALAAASEAEAPGVSPGDDPGAEDELAAEIPPEVAGDASAHDAPAVNFILSGVSSDADDTFASLRAQLNDVTFALTERAARDAATAARLRAALSEVRRQLASALAAMPAPDDIGTGDLSELVIVTRQAADNPRHLDYVTTLAARASEIADALEARPASEPDATLRATIEGLLARIDELLA